MSGGNKRALTHEWWQENRVTTQEKKMFRAEAMAILGLNFVDSLDESKIKQAWKQKVKHVHPDKSSQHSQESATQATQRLNEAKDTLLEQFHDPFEQQCREDEEERAVREKQRAEAEARKAEEDARFRKKCDDLFDRAKAIRHERQIKNRRKRLPTARAHSKSEECQEVKVLVEEMQTFFQDNFMDAAKNVLFANEILDLFVKSRDNTSILQLNLFKRHAKKQLLAAWPNAAYSSRKGKRCFLNICVK